MKIEIKINELEVFDAIDERFDNINRILSRDEVQTMEFYDIWQQLKEESAPLVLQNLAYEAWCLSDYSRKTKGTK